MHLCPDEKHKIKYKYVKVRRLITKVYLLNWCNGCKNHERRFI